MFYDQTQTFQYVLNVKIKKLSEDAIIPTRGTKYAAGSDLYANIKEPIVIKPHETKVIPTGIAMEIPDNYVGLIYARSGISIKRGLAPANKVGVIDSDYRGEILVALHNHGTTSEEIIEPGERIAQIVFQTVTTPKFIVVDELDDTVRGEGGFGSTGTK